MTTSLDSIDLLGDLVHARPRPRFSRPAARPAWPVPATPERVVRERTPPAGESRLQPLRAPAPTTPAMEAPAWPASPAPAPERARRVPAPVEPATCAETPAPPVPRVLGSHSIAPLLVECETLVPPPERAFGPAEPEFDEVSGEWFVEGTLDPFFDATPETALPWWALVIPAAAAVAMVSMITTIIALTSLGFLP